MNYFLFSIDLEDIRNRIPQGYKYRERVPDMTLKYLNFLELNNSKCTFFIVGNVARQYPELIKEIISKGHEIACHSDKHIPLTSLNETMFKKDLESNIESLMKAGATNIKGFRAPTFSLTNKTKWAYKILKDFGFAYSSSVLPAKNPLFGWENFGTSLKQINGITEIPISLTNTSILNIPFAGGVYFRVIPFFIIKYFFNKYKKQKKHITSYFHPYDIDSKQEKFMHPEINNKRFYNFLLYFNRKNTLKRLQKIIDKNFKIIKYFDYLSLLMHK